MDWSNERYVRIYVRETVGDVAMTWEARAIWKEILSRCDRAGVIPLDGHGVRGLAGLIRMPHCVVEKHFSQLTDDGRIQIQGDYLIVPNFIEAQEATQSDRQRASESRARRREKAMLGDILSQNETPCHKTNSGVTFGHNVSHAVTPCRAMPNRAMPNHTEEKNARTRATPPYTIEFENFRNEYPGHRHGGKGQDWKSWSVAKRSGMTAERANEYLGYWKSCPLWKKNGGTFIVAISRWLRDGYWDTMPADYEPSSGQQSTAHAMRDRSVEALKKDMEDEKNGLFD